MSWPVIPLSEGQLLDVRPDDVIADGHFRLCNTYRGGGGYDQFPRIASYRGLGAGHSLQFIVQLRGCPLDCFYCYVTRAGVWGQPVEYTSSQLIGAFNQTEATVFHLMGGAPALHMQRWSWLIEALYKTGKPGWVFHSDMMLVEFSYSRKVLATIVDVRAMYAVNIKGLSSKEFYNNTRKPWCAETMWGNLKRLEVSQVPYYITFTGCDKILQEDFWHRFKTQFPHTAAQQVRDSFQVPILDYRAAAYVDGVPWGV